MSLARCLVVAASCLLPALALAVPVTVGVQGALQASAGAPVVDGTYVLSFGIFPSASGGKPLWSEGPLVVQVKAGQFQAALGAKTPLDAKLLAGLQNAWLEVKVEPDPELPRLPLHSTPYSLRAGVAEGLECSGCVGVGHLDPQVLAPYVKAAALHKVATTGNFSDLNGGPDLSAYVKKEQLKAVAFTGNFADLDQAPVIPKVGAACGTGLVLAGFKQDGSHLCVAAMDPSQLPADGLDEISGGLLTNQFTETVALPQALDIPDNTPVGLTSVIEVPDLGLAQKLTVSVDLTNSDLQTVKVVLTDPANAAYLLYDKGTKGTALQATYPAPVVPVQGDLTAWVGKNPKGKWTLAVIDSGYKDNKLDGKLQTWSVNVSTLSSKKVTATGVLQAAGGLQLPVFEAAPQACTAKDLGFSYVSSKEATLYICNGKEWFPLALKPVGTQDSPGASCKDILTKQPGSKDGLYWVNAGGGPAYQVWCDMTNHGGGWTLAARMVGGSWCHIDDAKVGGLTSPAQGNCAKLSDAAIRALYTDQLWLNCGTVAPNRWGKIDNIQNFNTTTPVGNKKMTWSESYGGPTYTGTDEQCCNLGDHNYHNPHVIYSIAKGYNGGKYTVDWSGCYNSNGGWHQSGFLMVR